MTAYGENIVKPCKLHYKDNEFTIGSLGLKPTYEAALYRFIRCWRPDGDVEGIIYEHLCSFKGIGDKIACAIAEALIERGVEIKGIPDDIKPTAIIRSVLGTFVCTNCHGEVADNCSLSGKKYRYCPMCGNKLKVEEVKYDD